MALKIIPRISDRKEIREQAAILGAHKAIDYRDYRSGARELFDLLSDPGETRNIEGTRDDLAAAQFKRIADYRKEIPDRAPVVAGSVWSDSQQNRNEQLRALGYVE